MGSGHGVVAGMDEVGRGALAGPVTVGAVLVAAATADPPSGLRDSKLLRPAARAGLVPDLRAWALAWGVGHAWPREVDDLGIVGALGLAGQRALAQAGAMVPGAAVDAVLLDGAHDYLTAALPGEALSGGLPSVVTRVRGDVTCASVSAASVLAKVCRDALMVDLARQHPGYGWESNKGYGAPVHLAALAERGPCEEHRLSWSLPARPPAPTGGPPVHDGPR